MPRPGLSRIHGLSIINAARQAGFTLVEILVVVALIGLVSGLVVITIPSGKPPAVVQSQALLKGLNRASQSALIDNIPRAFGVSKDAHALFQFSDGVWIELSRASWPKDVTVTLQREEREVELPKDVAPFVIFEPTGQSTPFSLSLADKDSRQLLVSSGDGRVVLQ